jgi:hypothetical protein
VSFSANFQLIRTPFSSSEILITKKHVSFVWRSSAEPFHVPANDRLAVAVGFGVASSFVFTFGVASRFGFGVGVVSGASWIGAGKRCALNRNNAAANE